MASAASSYLPNTLHLGPLFLDLISSRSLNEAVFMALCEHPNVMPVNGILNQTAKTITLAMPYLEHGNIENFPFTSYLQFLQVLHGCFSGLSYMHSLDIVHTDVKPENLLVKEKEGELTGVVGDLGSSCLAGVKEKSGTFAYMSPELVLSEGAFYIHPKNDVWSMGVVLFELIYGPLEDHYDLQSLSGPSFAEVVFPKKRFYSGLTQDLFNSHLDKKISSSKKQRPFAIDDFVNE